MNKIRKYIYKKVLESVLQYPCPDRIRRSGNAGKRVNCYSINIDNESNLDLLINAVDEIGVTGRLWTGKAYDKKKTVSFEDLNSFKISITHYYGLCTITFDGIFDYLIKNILRIPYIRIWVNGVEQFVYNQTKLFRFERMQILNLLIEDHIENDENEMTSWNIMTAIHSIKWSGHPKGEQAHKRLRLFLDSLVETGEIKETDMFCYQVKGKAIDTLACFELEERRYKENLSLKWIMILFTFLMVIITFFIAVFAGLGLWKS